MDSTFNTSTQGDSAGVDIAREVATSANGEVSVVIPCLNEARSIAFCIDKALAALRTAGVRGEVVVADNGSTDGSIEIAEAHGARVVHVARRGYGSALRKGIEETRGDFIIMGDADDSYDFSEIPKFVQKWQAGYEFVMGNRFAGGIKHGAMPWSHRFVGNPALTTILNCFFRVGIGDAYCGMRGFTKRVYAAIDPRTTGMEFALELVVRASGMGARIGEVPISLWPDKRGRQPHLRTLHDGWRSLRFMLLLAPNWLFVGPGTFLLLVGLALVFWLLPGPRPVGRVIFDIHTMFFGMVFALVGMQIITTGTFAKVYSYSERFAPDQRSLARWLSRIKLEHGLMFGAIMALLGGTGLVWLCWSWVATDFGHFDRMRALIFFSLWLFIGVQVVFSSFFLSMLGISRGTYIGDYEKNA
jgi:glycosyltransferase involved in cell wall biosynthesis